MMRRIFCSIFIVIFVFSLGGCSFCKGVLKKPRYETKKNQGTYVHKIAISGFILGDKKKLIRIIKPYQKKYLMNHQIDGLLQEIAAVYVEAGFAGLVTIRYELYKAKLVINVELKK